METYPTRFVEIICKKFSGSGLFVICAREMVAGAKTKSKSRSPFDYAQGKLSAPLKNASLRMTGFLLIEELRVAAERLRRLRMLVLLRVGRKRSFNEHRA